MLHLIDDFVLRGTKQETTKKRDVTQEEARKRIGQ